MEKLRLPTFDGVSDPSSHVTSFNIAMRRANLSDKEKDACFCQLFVETLEGIALNWFTGLQENSVDSFHDLSTAFLKNYIMFKSIVPKVDVPDHIAVESLMNTLHIKSPFRADLYRHPTISVPDAIARSNNFIRMEEDTRANAAKEAEGKQTPARTNDGEPTRSNAVEPSKWCSYHDVKSHDTKDYKVLYGHFLKSIESGKIEIESPHKPKNNKSWSKNKEKKIQKSQAKAPQKEERTSPERPTVNSLNLEGKSTDEEPPKNRRRVEVILSRQANSSNDETLPRQQDLRETLDRKTDSKDLRTFLKRKAAMMHESKTDLRTSLDESKARKTAHDGAAANFQSLPADLREQINSKAEDLRVKLKKHDLQPCIEAKRQAHRELMEATNTPHLNVIMGGLPPYGDSVRAVKDYRRQAVTAQKWPSQVENDHRISFSAADTHGVSMPHNDPLLIDIGIGEYHVTNVLVDTGSSVDLIFRDTLDKMGVGLCDMKPSSRTLTGFNGSSKQMIGTIRLQVYTGDVIRTVKFSVVRARAPYNAILGTPWLHSMKAIPSTYHQCVKFPGKDGATQTIRGDQRAARDLLIAAVKLQQSTSLVSAVNKPIHKIYPQKEEIREVPIDEADISKVVRIGAYLSDEMQSLIISFLKENASTFACVTSDMKGIDPAITSHELNVDPTFKPIRQKRRKLGPERSKAVNEEVDRLLDAGFIAKVRYPEWLANPVVVKKKNGKWCICVDFTDLNKACPKDSHPLPHIDRLVESTAGNELLTFMDAFSDHLDHLRDCFKTLNEYKMKLNPAKCTFGVTSGEFLGYIVNQRGIEANPKKITAILDLPSPKNTREVQRLTRRIAALNRFISRSTDKCLPFYELLRGNKRFAWDEKCEEAFNQLKHYLTTPPFLSKPKVGDTLSLYIAVTSSAVSSVLIREDRGEQKPIFYISK
ncbi:PREDICTED: uncharacterized protein LOC106324220 [Brassica oleracea var. oleracea]|uniref:uncharacterized protein LOC106324220 n=1 Tax=Brassica oleracea var. oleracea TaxID=109376 RepID=UPI0006A6A40D|nr:PREDICTED: uncharacterized protein LOC106324220 [Brassica oleracea var. oleracea]